MNEKSKESMFNKTMLRRSKGAKEHPRKFIPLEEVLKKYNIKPDSENRLTGVDLEKHPPKHCPNCGSTNLHNQEMVAHSYSSELYDTYCRDCTWSGDISPDKHLSEACEHKTQKKETP